MKINEKEHLLRLQTKKDMSTKDKIGDGVLSF